MQIDPGALAGGEVHVWHGRITGEPASDDVAVLSGAERERAARFVRPASTRSNSSQLHHSRQRKAKPA